MSKAQTGHVTVFLVAIVCLAGGPTLAQPEFTIEQLPEGGGTASEPLAMHLDNNQPPRITVVGRILDASGIWQAAIWTKQGGQVFVLDITFHDPVTGSEVPRVWRLDESGSLGCTWCEDTVNLPAGTNAGAIDAISLPQPPSGRVLTGGWGDGRRGETKGDRLGVGRQRLAGRASSRAGFYPGSSIPYS